MEFLREDSWKKGRDNLSEKLKGKKGQQIFIASQKITPYTPETCVRKVFNTPNCEARFYLGNLESDEIIPGVQTEFQTAWNVSRTRRSHDFGWKFRRGTIADFFDLSSLGTFCRNIFILPPYTEKNGLLVYVGEEIIQNREILDSFGYKTAEDLLRFEEERLPRFTD